MAKKKRPSKKSSRPKSQLKLMPFKAHPREIRGFKKLAKRYCNGNVSEWLREAGLRYRPKAKKKKR